jgi:ketosteroid isomerase-like protein
MKRLIFALLCSMGLVTAAANAATPEAELMKPIHQFIDSFDNGDAAGAEAAHLSTGITIIDEVAPHIWQGPGAFKAWAADLEKVEKAAGMSEQKVTLGKVNLSTSTGDAGYVSIDAVYSYKEKGVPTREPARMTFALRKTGGEWKIAGWTWSGSKPEKVK